MNGLRPASYLPTSGRLQQDYMRRLVVSLAFSRRETILGAMTSSSLAAVAHGRVGPPIPFDNSYARLPEAFYERVRPLPVAAPQLLSLSEALAQKRNNICRSLNVGPHMPGVTSHSC